MAEDLTDDEIARIRRLLVEFGQVAWIGLYADPAAEDAANDALLGSDEYWTAVGRADELMIQGSGHRTGATRIA